MTGDNSGLLAPFLQDRAMLRTRLVDTVRVVQTLPEVDPKRVAAIGFCFGGLCVLDLARSGLEIRAVASFHGLFGKADGLPRVIAFHGWDDPMVPPSDVVALSTELTEAGADWQIHVYGHTMHGFMAEGVNRPEAGIQSYIALLYFLVGLLTPRKDCGGLTVKQVQSSSGFSCFRLYWLLISAIRACPSGLLLQDIRSFFAKLKR